MSGLFVIHGLIDDFIEFQGYPFSKFLGLLVLVTPCSRLMPILTRFNAILISDTFAFVPLHFRLYHDAFVALPIQASKLQPKRSNLKSPQLNTHLAILRHYQLLPIILQQISNPHPLHIKASLDRPPRLPTQAFVNPDNDAPALPLRQLATRHVLVVFPALDAVEDQRRRSSELNAREEGRCGRR